MLLAFSLGYCCAHNKVDMGTLVQVIYIYTEDMCKDIDIEPAKLPSVEEEDW